MAAPGYWVLGLGDQGRAEGRNRQLLLGCSQRNQQIGRNRHNSPLQAPPHRFSLRRPVDASQGQSWARWSRGGPLPLLLWKWQGCSWRLSSEWLTLGILVSGLLPRPCAAPGVRELGPQLWGVGGRVLCYLSSEAVESTSPTGTQAPPHTEILTQSKIRPFFTFFLKCKKLSAALERGSLDRPFYAKEKGAADGGSTRAVVWGTRSLLPPVPPYMHSLSHTQRHTHSPHSCRQMASDWLLSSPKGKISEFQGLNRPGSGGCWEGSGGLGPILCSLQGRASEKAQGGGTQGGRGKGKGSRMVLGSEAA